jgi:hypothetical protein
VPAIFPPKGQDNTMDEEKMTTVKVTGDLGLEIQRTADGQGIEYHAESDDPDWADVANQAMGKIGEVLAAPRGGCFGRGAHIVPSGPPADMDQALADQALADLVK